MSGRNRIVAWAANGILEQGSRSLSIHIVSIHCISLSLDVFFFGFCALPPFWLLFLPSKPESLSLSAHCVCVYRESTLFDDLMFKVYPLILHRFAAARQRNNTDNNLCVRVCACRKIKESKICSTFPVRQRKCENYTNTNR